MVFDTTILGSNPSAPAKKMKLTFFKINIFLKIKNIIFPFYRSKEILKIFNVLQKGYPKNKKIAMFVGGCVRKYILNEKIDDIDIATVLTPEEIKIKFNGTEVRIIETGIEHGSVTLLINDKKFEITTLRKDVKTYGRHAEVNFVDDWKTDSERRDFTINSIYMDIKGNFFDPQSGINDLKNNNIKFIGDPEKRINEDYLRIIRFVRFSLQYSQNEINLNAIEAIKTNLNGIKNLSKERILNELYKIFKLTNLENILNLKDLKEIFLLIFPELTNIERLSRITILRKKKIIRCNKKFILTILLVDESNNFEYFCHKYKVSNEIKNNLIFFSDALKNMKLDKDFFKINLIKNLYLIGKNKMTELACFSFSINNKINIIELKKIVSSIKETHVPKFPYSGEYLIKSGLSEGKKIGETLKELEIEWLRNNFSVSKEKITSIIKKAKN